MKYLLALVELVFILSGAIGLAMIVLGALGGYAPWMGYGLALLFISLYAFVTLSGDIE